LHDTPMYVEEGRAGLIGKIIGSARWYMCGSGSVERARKTPRIGVFVKKKKRIVQRSVVLRRRSVLFTMAHELCGK
jgi:hypothetical protein